MLLQALTLKECVNIDHLMSARSQSIPPSEDTSVMEDSSERAPPSGQDHSSLPSSYKMAAPLNEAELTALLLASPLYQKLEQMKKNLSTGTSSKQDASGGRMEICVYLHFKERLDLLMDIKWIWLYCMYSTLQWYFPDSIEP